MTVPTFLAPDPDAPVPNLRQRAWLLAALRAADGLLPPGVPTRSLNVLRQRGWFTTAPAADDGPLLIRYRITPKGRYALLSPAKATALLSVLTSTEPGRIDTMVQDRILASLLREGLAVQLTRHGERTGNRELHPHITNLGRRLVGLPEADDTPASDHLIAALASYGLSAGVETDSLDNTYVVYRCRGVEAQFFREVWNPDGYTYSARHPSWMHSKPWTARLIHSGVVVERRPPGGLDVLQASARLALSLVTWLADRNDCAFTA
ncbi:hypothetical protein [Streptomyces sp. CAU 1734]|uniref:hypothetical protein n=1 Tax=Streptomyces sp. CAU 1734 TaxID=3140360 RepID=UPI003261991B